jgi:hypothetical protein
MTVVTKTYTRKSFDVQAVEVTAENIKAVAAWCDGQVIGREKPFIKVKTLNPMNDKQTKAYIGDYVLYSGKGYKVYTKKAFEGSFRPKSAA